MFSVQQIVCSFVSVNQSICTSRQCITLRLHSAVPNLVAVAILDAKSYAQYGRWHGHKRERIVIAVMVAADGSRS